MSIYKFEKSGDVSVLLKNLQEIEDDIDFMIVVRVMKDKKIGTDWSNIQNSLSAIGAVAVLSKTVGDWCD